MCSIVRSFFHKIFSKNLSVSSNKDFFHIFFIENLGFFFIELLGYGRGGCMIMVYNLAIIYSTLSFDKLWIQNLLLGQVMGLGFWVIG